jgi:RNase adaptor protein for sRNA GlmZ degradation
VVYADDINIVGENIGTIQKSTETLLDASKKTGLEVSLEKTKHMLMSRYQKARQKHSIKIANRGFEVVAEFKYLGTALTDKNYMHKEIKNRLNMESACYHLVQSSHLLSKNVKVKIHKKP